MGNSSMKEKEQEDGINTPGAENKEQDGRKVWLPGMKDVRVFQC